VGREGGGALKRKSSRAGSKGERRNLSLQRKKKDESQSEFEKLRRNNRRVVGLKKNASSIRTILGYDTIGSVN